MSTNDSGKSKNGTILGGLGVIGYVLFKFKAAIFALLKFGWLAKSFLSMFISVGFYAMFFGWPYAVAIVLLLFIHEGGHWIWMKAMGLNPQAPMFIPFVGAFTAMTNLPPDAASRAWVAFAGPLIGGVFSAALYWTGGQTGNGWMMAAGSVGFLLNLIQLIPAKPLDGGFVVHAISKWLLLPGSLLLFAVAWKFHSVLLLIIGGISMLAVVKQLFGKGDTAESSGEVPATIPQRVVISIAYLALTGMLGYLYVLSQTTVIDVMRKDQKHATMRVPKEMQPEAASEDENSRQQMPENTPQLDQDAANEQSR